MINSDQDAFAIGLKVLHCALTVELNKLGEDSGASHAAVKLMWAGPVRVRELQNSEESS